VTLSGGSLFGAGDGALAELGEGWARAGIVKDAGDDPDVTHGALIIAEVAWAEPGSGVRFRAGEGVGTVTRPGLPLGVGEPAINPAPRAMIRDALAHIDLEDMDLLVRMRERGIEYHVIPRRRTE